eukprot:TRINITY_DN4983_c5_g1_i1.p1 TRINITY_DN4983_c5_g1~~TRINITY_DN4983_c5_g1_i1.p1  ORF type:complete len:357 (+),score=47.27 TRINITY_DN4983_c5_g1_i1:38-1108(+)
MAQNFSAEKQALVPFDIGDDVRRSSRPRASSTIVVTIDAHSLANTSFAAENVKYDVARALFLKELSLLSHEEVDYLSKHGHAGPSLPKMNAHGACDERVPETCTLELERLLSPALGIPQGKDEIMTDSVDAGIASMNARIDETEGFSASVLFDHSVTYGTHAVDGLDSARVAPSMSFLSTAPMSLDETSQQQCLSISANSAREEQMCSSDVKGGETQGEQNRTTVMLMNVPKGYTSSKLIRTIDLQGFAGLYDFIYVPMNFKERASTGCAVVNLLDPFVAKRFVAAFNGFSRWSSTSKNVCKACWSQKFQGLQSNVDHYRNSSVMRHSVPHEFKPRLFQGGTEIMFPPPCRKPIMG